VKHYRDHFKGRSLEDTLSRLHLAEQAFEARRKAQGLPPGVSLRECLTDEAIEYLQDRLLAEGRYKRRSPVTVDSIVRCVMTFARYCCKRKRQWIERLPEVERLEGAGKMKGRPITGEEFDRLLKAVPKIVGKGSAPSWVFTLRVLWESAFRIGDAMDFSWDDPRHIHPVWPSRKGMHPTLRIPATQKNGKEQEIPMLPGLVAVLESVPKGERVGWVINPLPAEFLMGSQKVEWFRPTAADLSTLAQDYGQSAIARACGVSEAAVRKWLTSAGVKRQRPKNGNADVPEHVAELLKAKAAHRHTRSVRRKGGRLTVERVGRIISQIGEEAKIVVRHADKETGVRIKYASAHDLRRGCAVRLINAGVSAEALQVVMRHADFSTTQKFYGATKQAQAAAAEIHTKLSPERKKDELVGGLVGGTSTSLDLTPQQLRKLKALLERS
jgi:integrase